MRKWVKYTLIGFVALMAGFAVLAGTSAYYFLRHLKTGTATEADALKEVDAIRTRYTNRPPMIDVVDFQTGDVRVQRVPHPDGLRAGTVHVMTWKAEDQATLRTDVPLWLMRFSSINVLSHLGIAPEKFRLTVEDLARYGPGIVVDYRQPGRHHVLIWLE